MLERGTEERSRIELICIEELVPKDHLLRKYFTGFLTK